MRAPRLGLALVLAGAAWASYQFYYTDNLTTIDRTKWTVNGSPTATASGLTGYGSLISSVVAPNGNDYDVRMTVNLANPAQCWGQYTVYARAASNGSTYYALAMSEGGAQLMKLTSSGYTGLAYLPASCTNGMVLRILMQGSKITVWANSSTPFTTTDSDLPSGQPGVGIQSSSDTISNVSLGPIDYVAPPPINQASISSVASLHEVDLQWPVGSDDPNGVGLMGYQVSRNGVLLGTTPVPLWWDQTVSPGSQVTYSLQAYDQDWNYSTVTTYSVTVPTSPGDESRVGVRPDGAYWGGAGEQIDMQSGNLNFSVPLFKALGRGGWGVTFALSYNSQMWRNGNGSVWLSGEDVGEGLGWKLQAGSILPVWFNRSIDHYVYSDATGATYRLDQNSNGVWTSLDSTYVAFNANNDYLYFPDGSFWLMNVTSVSSEQDAGTIYPSLMEDTNGNQIQVTYAAAAGYSSGSFNTSSRIHTISDSRSSPAYSAGYNNDWPPHITSLGNYVGTSENYTFAVGYQQVLEPFTLTPNSYQYVLQSATVTGLNIAHQFQYDSSAELTQVTMPLGGILQWAYCTYTYSSSGRSYREVLTRYLQLSSGGTQYQWDVWMDNGAVWHSWKEVYDVSANATKVWCFSTDGNSFPGLATLYEEWGPGFWNSVLLAKYYTWATDPVGRPYVNQVLTYVDPTTTNSTVATKTVQTLDAHGNLTSSQVFDYGNLRTPARTYNYYYLTGSNYTSRNIYNRLTSATVTPAGGSAITVMTNSYDGGYPPLQATQATMHDSNYGTSFLYRGNVALTTGLTSGDTMAFAYDAAGVVVQTTDALNHTVTVSTDSTTNYSLPTVVTPNGNSGLQTSMTYASSFAVTSVTGPNGATGTTTYDSYGRPSQTTIPDGAVTTYTYTYSPPTQTATVTNYTNWKTGTSNPQWKTTTLDGFGRVIQVDSGHDSVSLANTVSRVVTQYAPCACSPLLKVWRVSQPYNPNSGSPVWTTYTYDGSGRTLTVTAPDGASTTTTSYAGNSTTVTDAAGKWKTKTVDAFGNLTLVTEPNPAGGANWTTSYTYSALNQITQVTMPRPQGTQTRTFAYTGADLTSATNPENGTVTYTYDATHHVTSRTDAKGQQTQYTYDTYGRATEVQYYPNQNEDVSQRVTYTYDQGTNGMGRLTGVQFGGNDWYPTTYSYSYSYNQAGRVISQGMNLGTPGNYCQTLTATYQWDNEGRMAQVGYPVCQHGYPPPPAGPLYAMQYDNMGRLNGMTQDLGDGNGPQPEASAGYGPAGQMLNLSYFGVTETRTYNSLLQLTQMTATNGSTLMNMQYNYSSTQNNGRIASSNDYVTGENVSYSYDALNRLSAASAGSMWGEAYSYDGFGNLIDKTVTQAPAPALGVSYDANNHQLGLTYDANGNQLADAQGATYYWWNVENRLATAWEWGGLQAQTWYSYDPWGKRVMKDVNADPGDNGYAGGAWEFYFYGITGQKLMTLNCSTTNCWLGGYNVHFGGKLVASQYRYPVVTDRLGSVRYSGGVSRSYFPYGEERTVTLDDTEKFGTYLRDGPGQDYAEQRYYNNGTGRFWNVDPGGIKTARPSNPASLNRYAYVHDDPVNHTDRRGLYLDAQDCINDPEECEAEDWCDPDGFYLVEQPGCDAGGGSGPVSVAPPPPPPPKCWTQTGKIDATLNNLGTDIEADVANQFSSADKSLLTADIIWDISLEMSAIGPGTTSSPYYIGGHFNLNIFGSQIADFSPADQRYFYDDFAGKGAGTDGVRQAASTGLAAALGYTLHSQLQKNDPGIQQGEYSFHFDRFNPNNGLAGGIGHGVWDGLYGTLFHPCLDPAWHQ